MRFTTNPPHSPHPASASRRGFGTVAGWALPVLLVLTLLACPAWAKSAGASGQVDFTRVHQLYLNGDFDVAIAMLEDCLKENRQYSHDDSVFIYKHLGVMYAAQYETREKGKYYMHKLLAVEPTARIMDMYASDMIYMIFKNIQEEYAQTRMQLAETRRPGQGSAGDGAMGSGSATGGGQRQGSRAEIAKPSGSRTWLWIGLSAATVAAGVGLYVALNHDEPKPAGDREIRF